MRVWQHYTLALLLIFNPRFQINEINLLIVHAFCRSWQFMQFLQCTRIKKKKSGPPTASRTTARETCATIESQFVLCCCTSQSATDRDCYYYCVCVCVFFSFNRMALVLFYICKFKLICIRQGCGSSRSQILLLWCSLSTPSSSFTKNSFKRK